MQGPIEAKARSPFYSDPPNVRLLLKLGESLRQLCFLTREDLTPCRISSARRKTPRRDHLFVRPLRDFAQLRTVSMDGHARPRGFSPASTLFSA